MVLSTNNVPATLPYRRPASQHGQLAYGPCDTSLYSQSVCKLPIQLAYRPPGQLAYRPPGQLAYGPPNQSGYRPANHLVYSPDQDFQRGQYLTDDHNKVSLPEHEAYEDDQQIFVPKTRSKSVTEPVFRMGSHGAPWKHVKSVINSSGNLMCWIDGCVKQDENTFFPMYWSRNQSRQMYRPQESKSMLRNSYSMYKERARDGFRQWLPKKPAATKFTDYTKVHVHGY
ncbi:uncharacterized protein LOC135467157 [Liolophura sinensis]|uniref:uncharacterized protein LOC135467157 n=1 Tax=Liolophura sinensis TaxID=3198878 RepID=UPI003157FEC2